MRQFLSPKQLAALPFMMLQGKKNFDIIVF